ncbi:MAG: hypothetical protein BGO51_07655 [Rhodospirillales bacterium 69-11]|nr:DUF1365 family protein [Rhodospirillales bacterium]MBN8926324.1 DUF1365 family protein [Rhodospirillales bacterium]OJW24262.1 MAG: hypothetical protein BGO51_07655 [Rhodospirillales bacterium 69-11]
MNSALYVGSVTHRRLRPAHHHLRYPMLTMLLDLEELPLLSRRLRLFAHDRAAAFTFRTRDHGDGSATPLAVQVATLLRQAGLDPTGGRIRVLCMPRILGFVFNPLTVYFCHAADGRVQAMLYEVNNTFGQRHTYLIPVAAAADGAIRQSCDKRFHVSPFMDMALTYRFRVSPPGEALGMSVTAEDANGPVLVAALAARRRPLTDASLLRALAGHAWLAARVVGGIHWEALKIWRKGIPVRRCPAPPPHPVTFAAP